MGFCGSVPVGAPCVITITLSGDDKGIEMDNSCNYYSIGNQNISATATVSGTCPCSVGTILINGSTPPVQVCDGVQITVTVTCGTTTFSLNSAGCPASLMLKEFGMIDKKSKSIKINPKSLTNAIKRLIANKINKKD